MITSGVEEIVAIDNLTMVKSHKRGKIKAVTPQNHLINNWITGLRKLNQVKLFKTYRIISTYPLQINTQTNNN